MRPFDFPLLADENVHPDVVAVLRARGIDVVTVREADRVGDNDESILAIATQMQRVIITHDADFGRMAIAGAADFVGVIFLRPGHARPELVVASIEIAITTVGEVTPPFLLTIERKANHLKIRLRAAPFG